MKIEHIGLWVADLERMRQFYEQYLGGVSNKKYENPAKGLASYFLSFAGGCRLELVQKKSIGSNPNTAMEYTGFAHLAFSVGSQEDVDTMTNRLCCDRYTIIAEPRSTGDGYYESVVLDPEGNRGSRSLNNKTGDTVEIGKDISLPLKAIITLIKG